MITPEEYEILYRQALFALQFRGLAVGKPIMNDGKRFCEVSGVPRNDHALFTMAWGSARADAIVESPGRTLVAAVRQAGQEYDQASENYQKAVELFRDLQGSADGAKALDDARRAAAEALRKYSDAVQAYANYIVRDKNSA